MAYSQLTIDRLDKNLFYDGLLPLSSRLDQRYYTTTLTLAHDLCDVIHTGINTEPDTPVETPQNPALGLPVPIKVDSFSDYRERKKLGKRILKAVQPQLETALRLEAEANHRPFEGLKQQLETMIEASLEYRPKPVADGGDGEGEQSQDVIMVDSSAAVIAVGGSNHNGLTSRDENEDVKMTDADNQASTDGSIEVDTSAIETDVKVEGIRATADITAAPNSEAIETKPDMTAKNGLLPVNTPPETNGYISAPPTSQPAPPTPPQSNGSLGRQPFDALTDGGILWYLQEFEPEGTSAALEQWSGREAVRSLSEELTEIDDDELKELGVKINDESITASPADTAPIFDGANHASPTKKVSKARKRKTTYRRR
jgi:NuA3 HAT complex component NTO1